MTTGRDTFKLDQRDKIIDRLRKLFMLGRSANRHEAELALQRASEIMTSHQISLADMDVTEPGSVGFDDVHLKGHKRSTWIGILAKACATLYDAEAYYLVSHNGPGLTIRFFGTQEDIAVAQLTFSHLFASWKSIVALNEHTESPQDVRAFRRSHGVGYSTAILERCKALAAQRKDKVEESTGKDLVVSKQAAIKEAMANSRIIKRKIVASERIGYARGHEHGQTIPLGGAVGGQMPRLLRHG